MSDKLICPDDGKECIWTEERDQGCWQCPKIQGVLEKMKEADS